MRDTYIAFRFQRTQGAEIPIETELDTARAQLDHLPLDAPTQPGPLPIGSRMPLASNPLYSGRGEELRRVAAALKTARAVVLSGAEGVGKTGLAAEFTIR